MCEQGLDLRVQFKSPPQHQCADITVVQSDRSLIHGFDIACCTDLDALFNTRHIDLDCCKAQTAAAHLVSLVFSCVYVKS